MIDSRTSAFFVHFDRPVDHIRSTLEVMQDGKLVERSVPALVVPHVHMKSNLLGMSFLDRMESWEVRADKLVLHGYP